MRYNDRAGSDSMKLNSNSVLAVERFGNALAFTGTVSSDGENCGASMTKYPDRKMEKHPGWNGGMTTTAEGRVKLKRPDHPHSQHGYVYRYRLVMEEKLGRYLLPTEQVHHINGDCGDDRIENLQLLTTEEHHRLHKQEKVLAKHGYDCLTHKRCLRCGLVKPHSEFLKTPGSSSGKFSQRCLECKKTPYQRRNK